VGLVQSVVTLTGQIYMAKARTDIMFRWGLVTSAILVTAFLLGVRFGAAGVAAAYAIVYLGIILYPSLYLSFRLVDLRVSAFVLALLPQLSITAVMSVTCFFWLRMLDVIHFKNAWGRLGSTSAIGALVYVALMILLRPEVMNILEEIVNGSKRAPLLRITAFMRQAALRNKISRL
jgi:PST family polysaccharide transporter